MFNWTEVFSVTAIKEKSSFGCLVVYTYVTDHHKLELFKLFALTIHLLKIHFFVTNQVFLAKSNILCAPGN